MDLANALIKTLMSIVCGSLLCAMAFSLISCSRDMVKRVDDPDVLPVPPRSKGFLRLPQAPQQAKIYLDDRFVGRYQDYPRKVILIPIGWHTLMIKAHQMSPIYAEVRITPEEPVTLPGELIPSSPLSALP